MGSVNHNRVKEVSMSNLPSGKGVSRQTLDMTTLPSPFFILLQRVLGYCLQVQRTSSAGDGGEHEGKSKVGQ